MGASERALVQSHWVRAAFWKGGKVRPFTWPQWAGEGRTHSSAMSDMETQPYTLNFKLIEWKKAVNVLVILGLFVVLKNHVRRAALTTLGRMDSSSLGKCPPRQMWQPAPYGTRLSLLDWESSNGFQAALRTQANLNLHSLFSFKRPLCRSILGFCSRSHAGDCGILLAFDLCWALCQIRPRAIRCWLLSRSISHQAQINVL